MGFLDHLFKLKPAQGGEKVVGSEAHTLTGEREAGQRSAPDPGSFLHPKNFTPRGAMVLNHSPRAAGRSGDKAPPADVIVLTLGDVLSRIPTQLLKTGVHDERRELRFAMSDLSSDIARGRATVALSRIAAICPEVFAKEVSPEEDMEVRLPLQRLIEQFSMLRPGPRSHIAADTAAPASIEQPEADSKSPFGEEEIQLRLVAILPGCPAEIITAPLPPVADDVRITLPFAPIDRQLARGLVEVSSRRFVSVLPVALQPFFSPRDGVKVPLPLEEILKNIPASESAEDEGAPIAPPAADAPVAEAVSAPPAVDEVAAVAPVETPVSTPAPPPEPAPAHVPAPAPPPPVVEASAAAPDETVILKHRAFPVFTPPPPLVATEPKPAAPAEPAPAEEMPAEEQPEAVVESSAPKVHPPPVALPRIIPPPVHASAPAVHDESPPPAPAPVPLAPPHQQALRAILGAGDARTLADLAHHVAALPGLQGCFLFFGGESTRAGSLPRALDDDAIRALAADVSHLEPRIAAGALQSTTFRGDQASISIFARPGFLMCAAHRGLADLSPLAAIADALRASEPA
jgi:hypothetical protein